MLASPFLALPFASVGGDTWQSVKQLSSIRSACDLHKKTQRNIMEVFQCNTKPWLHIYSKVIGQQTKDW